MKRFDQLIFMLFLKYYEVQQSTHHYFVMCIFHDLSFTNFELTIGDENVEIVPSIVLMETPIISTSMPTCAMKIQTFNFIQNFSLLNLLWRFLLQNQ